ncbi:hypothetical protein MP228_003009 [Amoeboaphelidium protococcarum]|nr:hypothetical protein MP228_003009 [Amoeboaphelidium protococcarum]
MFDLKSVKRVCNTADNNSRVKITKVGKCLVKSVGTDGQVNYLQFNNVYYSPDFKHNLVPVSRLAEAGFAHLYGGGLVRLLKDFCVVGTGQLNQYRLYQWNFETITDNSELQQILVGNSPIISLTADASRSKVVDIDILHERMGHAHYDRLQKMVQRSMFHDLEIGPGKQDLHDSSKCTVCLQSKLPRQSFHKSTDQRSHEVLELVHMDLIGKINLQTRKKQQYILTIVDDFSGYVWVQLLQSKSQVAAKVAKVLNRAMNVTGKRVKRIKCDRGTEFVNAHLKTYCQEHGILLDPAARNTPQSNGKAERYNRSLVENARSMMLRSTLARCYWGYAIKNAAFVMNRLLSNGNNQSKRLQITPFEVFYGKAPDYKHIRQWGCPVLYVVPKKERESTFKFGPVSYPGYFLKHGVSDYIVLSKDKAKIHVPYGEVIFQESFLTVNQDTNHLIVPNELTESDDAAINVQHQTPAGHALDNRLAPLQSNATGEQSDTRSQTQGTDYQDYSNDAQGILGRTDGSVATQLTGTQHRVLTRSQAQLQQLKDESNFKSSAGDVEDGTSEVRDEVEQFLHNTLASGFTLPDNDVDESKSQSDGRSSSGDNDSQSIGTGDIDSMIALLSKLDSYNPTLSDIDALNSLVNDDVYTPETIKDALKCSQAEEWIKSIKSEFDSLIKNNTWVECDLPPNRKALPCRWVFKIKRNADGSIERYKSRLVIKGFRQIPGQDFNETFSPVVRMMTLRIVLALAAKFGLDLDQVDVRTAFLNGDLEEEIYMQGPEGTPLEGKVVKLQKSLYGLKQAPRQWNKKLDEFMKNQGLTRSKQDPCLYMKGKNQNLFMVLVYVDDIVLVTKDAATKHEFKRQLSATFDIHDLGSLSYLLGIKIERNFDEKLISLGQAQYVKKVLAKFGMTDCKSVSTPCNDKKYSESEAIPQDQYRSIVGALMYLMVATRPDLAYAVVERKILKWGKLSAMPVGYADANYASDPEKSRSITGSAIVMCGCAVSWKSKLQPVTAKSTTEAEYYAADHTASELMHCRHLLSELDVKLSLDEKDLSLNRNAQLFHDGNGTFILNEDNKSTIAIANNPQSFHKTKHIATKYHYIRDLIEEKRLKLVYCPTDQQVADIFTKSLDKRSFIQHRTSLGLRLELA